jgi:hypothetical protein
VHVPHLTYSLIPPFQIRENDIIVNECPKFQCIKPTEDDHAIIVDGSNGNLHIPLSLRGTTSYIDVRIELTYSTPGWEPRVTRYSVLEQQLQEDHTVLSKTGDRKPPISVRRLDSRLDVVERGVTHFYEHEASQSSAIIASINPMICDDWLASALQEYCCVSTIQTSTKFKGITAERLARNWNIPL